MCHGPSLDHVRSVKTGARMGRSSTETPVRFGRVSAAQSTAICAQCHAQSAVHDSLPGGNMNYSDQAQPFYRTYAAHLPSNFSRTAFYRDAVEGSVTERRRRQAGAPLIRPLRGHLLTQGETERPYGIN